MRRLIPLACAVFVALVVGRADARTIAIGDVHAEPDVADEGGALALLVRGALAQPSITIVDVPATTTVTSAPSWMGSAGAEVVVLLDLDREGSGLRVTTVVIRGSDVQVAFVRAGDGDLNALAKGVVERIGKGLDLGAIKVRDLSLAKLRPFARAIRLRQADPVAAARALAEADPLVTLTLPAVVEPLRGLPAALEDHELAAIAARALRDLAALEQLASGSDAAAKTARVFLAAERAEQANADDNVMGAASGPLALARLVRAATRSDEKMLVERARKGLASDQVAGVLAVIATFQPERLPAAVWKQALDRAERGERADVAQPGVISYVGLGAARANVDRARALSLVSVRELDPYAVTQLEPMIGTGTDATALRLRAELAMRRVRGEGEAVERYVAAAPADARAQRYHGWTLMAESKPRDAAAAFAKAARPLEQARALLVAGDPEAALAVLPGPPVSPEQHVIAARVAIKQNKPEEAVRMIKVAEGAAPASPVVHLAILDIDQPKPESFRALIAKRIAQVERAIENDSGGPTHVAIGSGVDGSGAGSGTGEGSDKGSGSGSARKVAVDVTPLVEMMELLPGLAQLEERQIVVAELAASPPWHSLRETTSKPIEDALVAVLAAAPYGLSVSNAARPITSLDARSLAALTESAPTALIYSVVPDGSSVVVTLTLFHRGDVDAATITKTIGMPGVVRWNTTKLIPIGIVLLALLVLAGLWVTRLLGGVKIQIHRPPDVVDEALCIEISRSETRPLINDPQRFHTATQKAGPITKARSATLVTGGEVFKVGSGRWYVHLYGTYFRGSQLRRVPDSCTVVVDVGRGRRVDAKFTLAPPNIAEVTVQMEAEPKRGVAIWTLDENERVFTNEDGVVSLSLPFGTHTLHIQVGNQTFDRTIQVVSAKLQRVGFNVIRERRMAQAGTLTLEDIGDTSEAVESDGTVTPAPPVKEVVGLAATMAPQVMFAKKPRAATPVPGETLLGRYRIVAELGRGAMGVVHRAFDEQLERHVAIKEMAEDLHDNADAMRMFTQEAKALAQLNHTNIVAMYDQVTNGDKVYLIMEYVDGRPLADILEERGAFPWREAVAVIEQVCAGLAYAHARKVIHRDIKPANIFVTGDRTAKIGDFGLARVLREVSIKRTEIRGTPLYMAPEQIKGADVDHRTDLYAVGCMFFELVCGRPPYIDGDILYAQMHEPAPAPSQFCPDLPAHLEELILSLIAKSADDRPGSANEVRAAMRSV